MKLWSQLLLLATLLANVDSVSAGWLSSGETQEYVAEIRRLLPRRLGQVVTWPEYFPDGTVAGYCKLEHASDGSRFRYTLVRETTEKDRVYCVEVLASKQQVLQGMTFGQWGSERLRGFSPDDQLLAVPLLGKGGLAESGGTLGRLGLAIGYLSHLQGLIDIHGDAFPEQCELLVQSETVTVTHRPTGVEFHFDEHRSLISIQRKVKVSQDEKVVELKDTLIPSQFGADGEILAFDVQPLGDLIQACVVHFDVEPLGEKKIDTFETVPIKNGARVALPAGQSGKRPMYFNGEVSHPVDPRAEAEIHKVLSTTAGVEPEVTQDPVRWPYLRTTSTSDCGLYSFGIAAAKAGVVVDLMSVIASPEYSSENGSTASQLRQLSLDHGLKPEVFQVGCFENLVAFEAPVIVHCGGSYHAGEVSHWAAVLAVDEKNRRVLWADLPAAPCWISESELLTTWDGTGIALLQGTDTNAISVLRMRFGHLLWPGLLFLGLGGAMSVARSRFPRKHETVISLFCLALVSATLALGWLGFSPISFTNSPFAVKLVQGRGFSYSDGDAAGGIKTLNDWEDWERDEGVLIVDARLPQDYARSHVQNAINLPPDCSLLELKQVWQHATRATKCIVYCQSEGCDFSMQIAGRLRAMGHPDIIIYSPGFAQCPDRVPMEGS